MTTGEAPTTTAAAAAGDEEIVEIDRFEMLEMTYLQEKLKRVTEAVLRRYSEDGKYLIVGSVDGRPGCLRRKRIDKA